MLQVAGGVECAFDDDAGVRKICGKIGAKALGAGECAGVMRGGVGIGFGELHDDHADCGVDVDGVIVAGKLAVEIESSAGTGGGDDGDGGALGAFYRGASGNGGSAAVS